MLQLVAQSANRTCTAARSQMSQSRNKAVVHTHHQHSTGTSSKARALSAPTNPSTWLRGPIGRSSFSLPCTQTIRHSSIWFHDEQRRHVVIMHANGLDSCKNARRDRRHASSGRNGAGLQTRRACIWQQPWTHSEGSSWPLACWGSRHVSIFRSFSSPWSHHDCQGNKVFVLYIVYCTSE